MLNNYGNDKQHSTTQLNSDYTIEYNANIQERGLQIVHSQSNVLLQGNVILPFDFESTFPICTIKKDGIAIQPKIDCGGVAIPIYDSEQNAVILYNHDAQALCPNSTLKKGAWFLSICICV